MGLDCLVKGLSTGLEVRLRQAVTAVTALQGGGVRVLVAGGEGGEGGEAMHADRVIVTVPLGVLKAGGQGGREGRGGVARGGVAFEPAPPQALRDAIARLGFGEALKVSRCPPPPLPLPPLPSPLPTACLLPPTTHHLPRTTPFLLPTTHFLPLTTYYTRDLPLKVALRFPTAFWPRDAHFLGKVGGGCSELGGGAARHLEFVNVAAYTGEPVLLLETEQVTNPYPQPYPYPYPYPYP